MQGIIIQGLDSKDLRILADCYEMDDLNAVFEKLARNGIVPVVEDGGGQEPNRLIAFEKRSD